ncbi:MAG: hypothetical protein M4579_006779 [Chaenotheca gracillima]|nr:MAG: hypothetical protein M4579_006779 [Chaenotheca gracillima]
MVTDEFQGEEPVLLLREGRAAAVQRGTQYWRSLVEDASSRSGLPVTASLVGSLRQVPSFTSTRHHSHTSGGLILAEGISTWSTASGEDGCVCDFPLHVQDEELPEENAKPNMTKTLDQRLILGIQSATVCKVANDYASTACVGTEEGHEQPPSSNFITALTLAWAYILSACWAESQEGQIQYTGKTAKVSLGGQAADQTTTFFCEDRDARRWWAALLAAGQGWKATMSATQSVHHSPWSLHLDERVFAIDEPFDIEDVACPRSTEAFRLLMDFCSKRGLMSQVEAALGVALTLPSHAYLKLPPRLPRPNHGNENSTWTGTAGLQRLEELFRLIPNLMTISSLVMGLTSILCGIFYEDSVSCNLCSEWLEPMSSAFNTIIDSQTLAVIGMLRRPGLGRWWLGATVSGLSDYVLREVKGGTPPINLSSWWWTRHSQSFLCSTSAESHTKDHWIPRRQEALLRYLTQKDWSYCPPWMPPGWSHVEDLPPIVRAHARCGGHALSLEAWHWVRQDGSHLLDLGKSTVEIESVSPTNGISGSALEQGTGLEHMSDSASKQCSRMIFWWLGRDGTARRDRHVYEELQDWVGMAMDESDNSSDSAESVDHMAPVLNRESSSFERVAKWVDQR